MQNACILLLNRHQRVAFISEVKVRKNCLLRLDRNFATVYLTFMLGIKNRIKLSCCVTDLI